MEDRYDAYLSEKSLSVISFFIEFFTEYIDKNQPVLFKKVVLESPAYKLFNDDFLESFPNADKAIIYAEPEKKENRTKKGFDMSFKEFVKRYKKESLYMVNALPMELRSVLFPCTFCNLFHATGPFLYHLKASENQRV